jgi:hypothetical protein
VVRLETTADRAREQIVAKALASAWDKDVVRYSDGDYAPVDFQVLDGRVPVALVEMKCRDNSDETYPTLYVAQRKVDALATLSAEWGVPGLFVGAFSNGVIRAVSVRRILAAPLEQITRTRPRASGHVGLHDRELARLVPIERMTLVATLTAHEQAAYNRVHQRAR